MNLELKDPDIVFNPSLDDDARKGFYRLVEGLLYDVVHMSELVMRVAAHKPRPHYRVRGDLPILLSFASL